MSVRANRTRRRSAQDRVASRSFHPRSLPLALAIQACLSGTAGVAHAAVTCPVNSIVTTGPGAESINTPCTVNDGGRINNVGILSIESTTLSIASGGTLDNQSQWLYNFATLSNSGQFFNRAGAGFSNLAGTLDNNSGGTLTNDGTMHQFGNHLNNAGVLNNAGALRNYGKRPA